MRLARCERGTASVEIAVMLPVFIVLLMGVMQIHRVGLAAQESQSAARACAYYFAANGCTSDAAKNAICAGLDVKKTDAIDTSADGKEDRSPLDALESWPVFGSAVSMLFGEGSRAVAEREARDFMGNEARKVAGRFYMVCNTESKSWTGKISDLLCSVADSLGTLAGCK